jgi:hypothetical protein
VGSGYVATRLAGLRRHDGVGSEQSCVGSAGWRRGFCGHGVGSCGGGATWPGEVKGGVGGGGVGGMAAWAAAGRRRSGRASVGRPVSCRLVCGWALRQ